jgi:hypothetical protein
MMNKIYWKDSKLKQFFRFLNIITLYRIDIISCPKPIKYKKCAKIDHSDLYLILQYLQHEVLAGLGSKFWAFIGTVPNQSL